MLFKKNENYKTIEELSNSDLVKVDIDFSRSAFGKKLYRLSILAPIMTAFSVIYVFANGVANGYIDLGNIGIILMVGLGLSSITRMIYYQSLARYYSNLKEKK